MIGDTYLGLKLLRKPFKIFSTTTIKSLYFSLNTTVINTTNFSNSLHGQTFLKDTIFSVLISPVTLLVRNALMSSYIFSTWYKLI